ncbi:hypothetical protein [Nonomuraea aridisoli]|uniref:Adhesin domain-containing protein n=1 Tax=Nonomuraea aridisoli TaxID=2070368 RepID=A0A2W2ENB6_9ACTN|nr:hypothetical protein [Nonomuraea aridisoli]PZG15080.1 hypothetical protein C1J01_25055 [Nonomuraea aridisoli]
MRALWLAAGAVLTVVALVVSTTVLWHEFARARTPRDDTTRSIPFAHEQVRIIVGEGDVSLSITSGRAGELWIGRSLRWSRDRPTVTEDWDERTATLRLEAVCPDQPAGPLCHADYAVSVPPETDVEANMSHGPLFASDLFGSVRLTSSSGIVHVMDLAGPLRVRTGTGDVLAERLAGGEADVETGSGMVQVSFMEPPDTVRAVVRTRGDVTVRTPAVAYDVDLEAARSRVDVERDELSTRKITARAPRGTVSLSTCCG